MSAQKELLRLGLTRSEFESLWRSARSGDDQAKLKLYQLLKQSPELQALSRRLGVGADKSRKAYLKASGKQTSRKKDSAWTKAANSLGVGAAQILPGGLPSLGKGK